MRMTTTLGKPFGGKVWHVATTRVRTGQPVERVVDVALCNVGTELEELVRIEFAEEAPLLTCTACAELANLRVQS